MTLKIVFAAFAVACLFLIAGISYLVWNRNEQLKEFRQNLRCGDQVRIMLSDGRKVRARIAMKNNVYSVWAVEIDQRTHHLIHISSIYRP